MKKAAFIFFSIALMAACTFQPQTTETEGLSGNYLGELNLNDSTVLSFIYTVMGGAEPTVMVHNGEEKINLTTSFVSADSIVLDFPVYQSRLVAKTGEGVWTGYFEKLDAPSEYRIPFIGSKGISDRLPNDEAACCPLANRWKVAFTDGEKTTPAIGEFALEGNRVSGTFLTQSGDYRYLRGKLNGNNLTLFGFDGGYIQVFKATVAADTIFGQYYSGLNGYKTWNATPSETFQLENPANISTLNAAQDSIVFTYPDLNNGVLVYTPHKYKGKVVVMQITGSWCPNCKDQALLIQQLQDDFGSEKLAVMGIAFERMGTLEKSIAAAKKSKEDLGVNYPVGIAKYSRDQVAEEVFPYLEKIRGYPTLIIIGKKGEVRKIHTGFAGPGTSRFEEESNSITQWVKDLLNE